jgi:hypothetical protein
MAITSSNIEASIDFKRHSLSLIVLLHATNLLRDSTTKEESFKIIADFFKLDPSGYVAIPV